MVSGDVPGITAPNGVDAGHSTQFSMNDDQPDFLTRILGLVGSFVFCIGVVCWIGEGTFAHEREYFSATERREDFWWLLVLAGWFYPARILLQFKLRSKLMQTFSYSLLILAALVWIYGRLVYWGYYEFGNTIYSDIFGCPIGLLFLPTVCILYDWTLNHDRTIQFLAGRTIVELALLIPWNFLWGFTMLYMDWLWI